MHFSPKNGIFSFKFFPRKMFLIRQLRICHRFYRNEQKNSSWEKMVKNANNWPKLLPLVHKLKFLMRYEKLIVDSQSGHRNSPKNTFSCLSYNLIREKKFDLLETGPWVRADRSGRNSGLCLVI